MRFDPSHEARFRQACDAALDQCRVVLAAARDKPVRSWSKRNVFGHPELASEADMRAQEILTTAFARRFPGVPVIAEEGTQHLGSIPGTCILVDPIDGTVPFLGGSSFYTITACLVDGGRPVQAVVDFPAYRVRVLAGAGQGTRVHGQAACLPGPGPAAVLVSPAQAEIARKLSRSAGIADIRPVPTTSMKMTLVALGRAGAAIRLPGATGSVAPWDYAAAALIVVEAGGIAHDEHDRDLARSAPSIVNGWLACREPGLAGPLRRVMARPVRQGEAGDI
jgi:fructose-1,6-bisphosphatase/inositol monophosphatase family enzyme